MGAPDAEAIQVTALDAGAPWRLFDFGFADFNALARPPVRGETLTWSMALAWPDAPPESTLKSMGVLTAAWQGAGPERGPTVMCSPSPVLMAARCGPARAAAPSWTSSRRPLAIPDTRTSGSS